MATFGKIILSDSLQILSRGGIFGKHIHYSTPIMAGGKWREQHGRSHTGTSYGPLTDLPDWSYVDGRPSPALSKRQSRRKTRTLRVNSRVKTLLKEIDLAKLESKRPQEGDINNTTPTAATATVEEVKEEERKEKVEREEENEIASEAMIENEKNISMEEQPTELENKQ